MNKNSLAKTVVPYYPEYRQLAGSIAGTILMRQLEYWFARYPKGFYKFVEPSKNGKSKTGDSWSEELGISRKEFDTAFKKIGHKHKSTASLGEGGDDFKGMYYCSVYYRSSGETWYYRNDVLVEKDMKELERKSKTLIKGHYKRTLLD